VEVKFLLAGYRLPVSGRRMEGPLLDCCDDGFVDAVAETAGHFDICDSACCVDDDVEDDIAFGAAREDGEIWLWCGEVAGERDVDVALTEGVCTCGGVRVWRGWGVGVGRDCGGLRLRRGWSRERIGSNYLRHRFWIGCCGLNRSAARKIGDHEVGAVLVAGETDGRDERGSLMNEDGE
jgi:hypothetical protein